MSISPDLAQYGTDLKLYDQSQQQVFDAALQRLQMLLPEWVPAEGHTEVLVLEAVAVEVAEEIFAINRLPSSIVQTLLGLYGVVRDVGATPTVTVIFTAGDTLGHIVPSGTRVQLDVGAADGRLITFITDVDATIPAASSVSDAVLATGTTFTSAANGIGSGVDMTFIEGVSFIDYVETATAVIAGRDPETGANFLLRGVARFARLTETLVLPSQFAQAALDSGLAFRAFAVDNYQPGTGTVAGHITVVVYGEGDAVVSAPDKATLLADFQSRAATNLSIHIADPTVTAVDVTTQVKTTVGNGLTVLTDVTAALNDFLNTDTWQWGGTVRRFELLKVIGNVADVLYVETLTTPAADVTLSGYANLVRAGTLNVTSST